MVTYSFSIQYTGTGAISEPVINQLFEAGCDDATFHSHGENAFADFDREAESLDDALRSAIKQIESVGNLKVVDIKITGDQIADLIASID